MAKQIFCSLFLGLLLAILTLDSNAQQVTKKIKIVLIGTFHWRATSDAHATSVQDLYSKKKQKELDSLLLCLYKIPVDKIFVEAEPEQQCHWDSVYRNFKAGLPSPQSVVRNEIYQIAFKLALHRGVNGVKCVNFYPESKLKAGYIPGSPSEKYYLDLLNNDNRYLDTIMAKNHMHPANQNSIFSLASPFQFAKYDSIANHSTLLEFYRYLNSEAFRDYCDFGNLKYYGYDANSGNDFAGADFAANIWYTRNLKIFVNILRNADYKNDSCYAVLFGASHIPFLSYLFRQNPYFEVVEVNNFLSDKQ